MTSLKFYWCTSCNELHKKTMDNEHKINLKITHEFCSTLFHIGNCKML